MSEAESVGDWFFRMFPRPCRPRKRHLCRLCGGWIEAAELCCRWSGFQRGEGPFTSRAHAECYAATRRWDEGDWECCLPGDLERPTKRMEWPSVEDGRGGR